MKIYQAARTIFALVLMVSCASAETSALSLADHAPSNAVAYFGWSGSIALAPAFAASPLRTLIAGSNLPEVASELLPKLRDRLAADPANQPLADAIRLALSVLWRHPAALYITDVSLDHNGNPLVHFGLICDAATDADSLLADFAIIAKESPDTGLKTDRAGSIVRLTNDDVSPGASLDQNISFQSAMKPLQPIPAIALFVDGEAIGRKADAAADKDESARDIWPKVRDALGIAHFKSYAMTAGFDGGNWVSASALIAPGPRVGLLAAIEPKPIDPALLARIPGSAESVAVYNFDAAKLFDSIADAMTASQASDTLFHRGAGAATMVLGRNLRRAILGPLGPQWVIYTDARTHATAMLNHPTDADTASDSMVSAAFGLINTANAQIPGASVLAVQQKIDGIDLTSAKSAAIERFVGTPTFALQDGILYFGSSPEAVVTSAKFKPVSEAADFLHDESFATALYRLRVPSAGSIDYCNLPKTAARAYERLKGEESALDSLAKLVDLDLPKINLPPLETLQPQLSPAISVSWADADGVYAKSISPFPGSAVLLGDPQESVMSAGTASMLAGILVPAFGKAREQADLVARMRNERQLLLAMITWSIDHQGMFPPDLGSLVGTAQIDDLTVFLRHGSGTKVPPEIATASPRQQAAWVNEHAEFIYLAANKKFNDQDPATTVVLIEKDNLKAQNPVGFADGHVEACSAACVKRHVDHAEPQ